MMDLLHLAKDYILGFDKHLDGLVESYGLWVYGFLFLIIFCETGLVVTPFLPGDSLLFAAGAVAARPEGKLNIGILAVVLLIAAILGDAANYAIGNFIGPRIFTAQDRTSFWHRLLNRDHLMKAHAFYERYGGKAVVLGRFVPIARTFVPFVAGCGSMAYSTFFLFNVLGAMLWVGICLGAGYGFGNIKAVQENFEFVVVGIVFVSLLPILWGYALARIERKRAEREANGL
jgi:membrane-associated protein